MANYCKETLELVKYIPDLDTTYPTCTDVIKYSFPSPVKNKTTIETSTEKDATSESLPLLNENCFADNWQGKLKSPKSRLSALHRNENFSDLVIQVDQTGYEIKVHKMVLAVHSPVFERIFYGSMKHESSEFVLKDISEEAVRWIFDFIYKGNLIFTSESLACEIYRFAHQWQMNHLFERCSKFLKMRVNSRNVIAIGDLAALYGDIELRKTCAQVILEKKSILAGDRVTEISKLFFLDLLSQDMIQYPEVEIFLCIHKWASHQLRSRDEVETPSALREELRDFMPLIRFLTMPTDDFIDHVLSTEILTAEEGVAILKRINDLASDLPDGLSDLTFDRKHQKYITVGTIDLFDIPKCDLTLVYNNNESYFTDKILIIKCSHFVELLSIHLRHGCFRGKWRLCVVDLNDRFLGISEDCGPPWEFQSKVFLQAKEHYVVKLQGKGRRHKHPFGRFDLYENGINFEGFAMTCKFQIRFFHGF